MQIPFVKMHGAGNDFVVIDRRATDLGDSRAVQAFVQSVCDRRRGVGADGVLFLDPAGAGLDFRMTYYNQDGGEADLCGNGGRCLAAFAVARGLGREGTVHFESRAGRHTARVQGDRVELSLGDVALPEPPRRFETPSGDVNASFVRVGVPHVVVEVDDVDGIDIARYAPPLRHHPGLGAEGANVDLVQWMGPSRIRLRTFERGVEGETLACGTGAAAAAIALVARERIVAPVQVQVAGGELLEVSFSDRAGAFHGVLLTGPVHRSFEGLFPCPQTGEGSGRS